MSSPERTRTKRVADNRRTRVQAVTTANDDPRSREIDDDYVANRVIIGSSRTEVNSEYPDDFSRGPEVYKTMAGLSDTTKKRASRAFQKFHQGAGGAQSKKVEQKDFISGYDLLGVELPPYNLDYLAKLYTASPANFAAIGVKVANIVGLGFDFIDSPKAKDIFDGIEEEEKMKKAQKKQRRMKQDLNKWLEECHDEDDFLETLKKIYTDYESTGNGYMEIGRKANGQIGYIGHIPAVTMRVRKNRDGFVQVTADKARFFRHFGKDTADPIGGDPNPNEVIHLKKYSPTNSYYGIPDIIAAITALAGNEFAARYNLDYFENKAIPRYAIIVKGGKLGTTSQRDIVEFFESGLRGNNHRTIFVPLPADTPEAKVDFKMEAIEAGIQDASFVNYNKINMQAQFMAHRTPMTKATIVEGVSLAAARDADKTFKEGVCRPEQKVFEKKFGKVIREITDSFIFKLNELTLTDEDTQSKIDERYLRWQVLVPNEIRARAGMTGLKGGDKVVDPAKMKAEMQAQAMQSRTRDAERSAGATDSAGEGRNAKGDGRSTG